MSGDSPQELFGCGARIRWAERGVQQLNDLTRRYALTLDEPDHASVGPPQLLQAALLASNVVHQLRSALDNLVWQLVILNGQKPCRPNAFPVWGTDNAEARKDIRRRMNGVAVEHAAAIVRCQPYHPDYKICDDEVHPLWALDELWSADKHRVLSLVSVGEELISLTGPLVPGFHFVYAEDGKRVVDILRTCGAAVEAIIDGFEPVFSGEPNTVRFTRPEIVRRFWESASRDPTGEARKCLSLDPPRVGLVGRD